MVSCFLTPSLESRYTYPPALRDEIAEVVGEYVFDTKDFRTDDKDSLLSQIYEMTDRRFALAGHLLETKPWQLFAMVEWVPTGCTTRSGSSWTRAPQARAGEPVRDAILDYHRHVDGLIARLLEHADEDTVVFVLSDHGAKRLDGGIRINEWLRREGCSRRSPSRTGWRTCATSASTGRARPRGGGRLLRAGLPQREGPRARRGRGAGGVRGGARRPRALAHRRDPGRRGQPDPDRGVQARGPVRGPAGRGPTSSSSSATSSGARSGRSAATRASRRSRTTPAPTTRTTPRTASTSSPGRASRPRPLGRAPARHRPDRARAPRPGPGGDAWREPAPGARPALRPATV